MSLITDRGVRAVTRALLARPEFTAARCQADDQPLSGYWHGPDCDSDVCRIVAGLADADLLGYEDGPLTPRRRTQVAYVALTAAPQLPNRVLERVASELSADGLLAVDTSDDDTWPAPHPDPCPGCTTEHLNDRLRAVIEWASSVDHGRAVELDRVVAALELRWQGHVVGPTSCAVRRCQRCETAPPMYQS